MELERSRKDKQRLDNFDLNLLQLFRAVLVSKSISKAAVQLRITQPAASNGLRRLRDALNDEIFIKGPDGMTPTDFARTWALQVIPALELIDSSLTTQTQFDPAEWRGTLLIGITDYLMEVLMYEALPKIMRMMPRAQLRLIPMREREPHDELEQGKLDLALGSFFRSRSNFYQKQLGSDEFVMILRKDHPRAKGKWSPQSFAESPQVLIAPWGLPHGVVDDVLAGLKLERSVALTVPYFNAAPRMVEQTDLISTVPLRMAKRWQRQYAISLVKPPIEVPPFKLYMLWAQRSLKNPAHEWLRAELLAFANITFASLERQK